MDELSPGARKIMSHLVTLGYKVGDYLPAGRLYYIFDDPEEKRRALDELVVCGFVTIAPNLGVGITQEGENWNSARPTK